MRLLAIALGAATMVSFALPMGSAAAAPPTEPFEDNNAVWGCGFLEGEVPTNHCRNLKSQGSTGLIMVAAADPRWPQESYSTDPKADTRPCPHDDSAPPAEADGTWWEPITGFWVCHHRP